MRVTNQSITRSSVVRLQENLRALERAQRDISSGRRLHSISENPSDGSDVMRTTSSMRAIGQFRRNIDTATARSGAEERVLDSLTNSLGRAIELGITQQSGTATDQTRLIAKKEVDQLIDHVVTLGNTKYADDFLFGGTRSGEAPLRVPSNNTDSFSALADAGGNSVDPSGGNEMEIGDGKFILPTHNATEIFLDTKALQSLRDLSAALGANDSTAIASATNNLKSADTAVQTVLGQQGSRGNELQASTDLLSSLELTLDTFRSQLRDTEIEKTMVEFVGRQTQYQAAMAATTRILGLSLANYL